MVNTISRKDYTMNKAEKSEFYKELFALAIPIGMQNLLLLANFLVRICLKKPKFTVENSVTFPLA